MIISQNKEQNDLMIEDNHLDMSGALDEDKQFLTKIREEVKLLSEKKGNPELVNIIASSDNDNTKSANSGNHSQFKKSKSDAKIMIKRTKTKMPVAPNNESRRKIDNENSS